MFFSERIKSIKPGDRVLEVGPGGNPHHRSDVLLDKVFDEKEWFAQSGNVQPDSKNKKTIFYDGDTFPFKDKEFDYVICSHVLEHVTDIDQFTSELKRVAKAGYIEFPTIYYDYIYNFEVHTTFLLEKEGTIHWMLKSESNFEQYKMIQNFFRATLDVVKYDKMIYDLKEYLFQGFEWFDDFKTKKTDSVNDVCYDLNLLNLPPFKDEQSRRIEKLETDIHSLENSKTYKIGKLITHPFSILGLTKK